MTKFFDVGQEARQEANKLAVNKAAAELKAHERSLEKRSPLLNPVSENAENTNVVPTPGRFCGK